MGIALCVMEAMWKERNSVVHGQSKNSIWQVLSNINRKIREQLHVVSNAVEEFCAWSPPPASWLCCNCDVSCDDEGMVVETVVRDDQRRIVTIKTERNHLTDPLIGEAVAVCMAAELMIDKKVAHVVFQSDNIETVKAFSNATDRDCNFKLVSLRSRFQQLCKGFQNWEVGHVPRRCNFMAHNIAKWARENSVTGIILCSDMTAEIHKPNTPKGREKQYYIDAPQQITTTNDYIDSQDNIEQTTLGLFISQTMQSNIQPLSQQKRHHSRSRWQKLILNKSKEQLSDIVVKVFQLVRYFKDPTIIGSKAYQEEFSNNIDLNFDSTISNINLIRDDIKDIECDDGVFSDIPINHNDDTEEESFIVISNKKSRDLPLSRTRSFGPKKTHNNDSTSTKSPPPVPCSPNLDSTTPSDDEIQELLGELRVYGPNATIFGNTVGVKVRHHGPLQYSGWAKIHREDKKVVYARIMILKKIHTSKLFAITIVQSDIGATVTNATVNTNLLSRKKSKQSIGDEVQQQTMKCGEIEMFRKTLYTIENGWINEIAKEKYNEMVELRRDKLIQFGDV
ncbi:hypothetical protein G4B88_018204 [Cannabis sativa]|uniref:RNase H type-1 domain-containing protein n=1 Tax=Cannabis sativa TaxID=3483 RepID=A0A7J6G9K2_CANSA|nr:hypothetical protein G4B88_018204 [Cannabis sativa]